MKKHWGVPFIIIGIFLLLISLPGLLTSVISLSSVSGAADDFAKGEIIGRLTGGVVFFIVALWLIIRGNKLRKLPDPLPTVVGTAEVEGK